MDWNAYHFQGHPVAKLTNAAPVTLRETTEMLDALDSLIAHQISCILRPSRPGPSPRDAAHAHAALLSDVLLLIYEHLRDVRVQAKYRFSWVSYWGDEPDGLLLKRLPFPADIENDISVAEQRAKRLGRAVRRKQQVLRFALHLVEAYAPGQTFQRRIPRALAREAQPLVKKVHRDATGVHWTIQGDDDARLRDIHQLPGMADEGAKGEGRGGPMRGLHADDVA